MIVFLDNGLRGVGEHSFQLLTAVTAELRARGLESAVYGYRRMRAEIATQTGAHRHFRDHLYVGRLPALLDVARDLPDHVARLMAGRPLQSEMRTARLTNTRYRDDLAALPVETWDAGNLVVVPALTQNQVSGLADFLQARRGPAPARVICQLMMDVGWTPWGAVAAHGETLYRDAFARLRPFAPGVRFTAENPPMAESYASAFDVEVGVLPVPLGRSAGGPRRREGRVRLGFFGYSKTEKGFHLLPDAIRRCEAAGLAVAFVVQVQHGGWEAETVKAEKALRTLPGVTIVEGELESARYRAMQNEVDATLLPYDPARFGVRGSGVLTEAISAGLPVVASRGIYAARKIADGSAAGEIVDPYTSAGLAAAIGRLVARIDDAMAQAARLADVAAREHSAGAYVDVLLSR